MDIFATLYDNRKGKLFNISEVISDISITSYFEDNAGKCTFTVLRVDGLAFWEGATVTIVIEGKTVFKGYVFTKERDEEVYKIKVTCIDQLRYLKNKDIMIFEGMTASDIFKRICEKVSLNYKIVSPSKFICSPRINDNKSYYEMIKYAMDETLINTGKCYMIRDNAGVLEFVDVKTLQSPMLIGDMSGITSMKYKTTIDSDVYNRVKLYTEDTKTKKHTIVIVDDTSINKGKNLREWGLLQYVEKVDNDLNVSQMKEKAMGILRLYDNVKRELSFSDCIGDFSVFAGSIVHIKMSDIGDLSVDDNLLVTECTHKIKNDEHLMDFKVKLVI